MLTMRNLNLTSKALESHSKIKVKEQQIYLQFLLISPMKLYVKSKCNSWFQK